MADQDRNGGHENQRRRLLQAGLGAAALGAIPGAGQLAAHAQGAFDWKKFKGEKIEVFLVKSPRGDLLTKYHKEFEDLTGISVGSEMIPEQQQRQKAVIEFNSGNTSFDVIALSYHVQKRMFGKNKWMEDVRPLLADKSMTDPNLDFADFSKGGMAWATQADGRIDSLPFNIDPWVIYYNKELFDAKKIAYPKSFPEIVDAAAKLNDPAKAEPVVQRMIQLEPQESTNYFMLAKIYEDAGAYENEEEVLLKVKEIKPDDPAVYMTLAGYYKRQGQIEKMIQAAEERANHEPKNPDAHYTVGTFYWDEVFRDTTLKEDQKRDYLQRGIGAIDKAIEIKPDYSEALVIKGLLLRLQANLEKDPAVQQRLIKDATVLRDKAEDLRKKKTAGVGN